MNDEEKKAYYVAAGRSLTAIEKWREATAAQLKEWDKFQRKHKGKLLCIQNHDGSKSLSSIDFGDGKLPVGWRIDRKHGHARPDLKTSIGKELRKEMDAMRTAPLGTDAGGFYMAGLHWCTPGVHQIGKKWIITHHADAPAPIDAKRLKTSQYFAMKEREEATA